MVCVVRLGGRPVLFRSTENRPVIRRVLWAIAGVAIGLVVWWGLTVPAIRGSWRLGTALLAVALSWPVFALSLPRSAQYFVDKSEIVGTFGKRTVFRANYRDIEYVGYSAELIWEGGIRYMPWSGGILYLTTRRGFLITVDFRRPLTVSTGMLLKMPARRVLFTVDDAKEFLHELRLRVDPAGGSKT